MDNSYKEIQNFLDFYYESNYDTCDEVIRTKNYDLIFSDVLTDIDTNYIWHKSGDLEKVLIDSKDEFLKRNHKQAVYITPLSDMYDKKLTNKFIEFESQIWMSLKKEDYKKRIVKNNDVEILKLSKKDIDLFLDVFSKGFGNDSDVFGVISEDYLKSEIKSFEDKNNCKNTILLAKYNGKPAGIIRSVIKDNKGFITSFCVVKEYRRKGVVANILGSAVIEQCFRGGCNTVYLSTKADSINERLYSIYGFKKFFKGTYYYLDNND